MYLTPPEEWGPDATSAKVAPLDLDAEVRARS